jgi:hypothetical protein
MLTAMKWIGTVAGVVGAAMIALNWGVNLYGYMVFLVSSLLWLAVSLHQRERSLAVLQLAYTIINLIGLYRYGAG